MRGILQSVVVSVGLFILSSAAHGATVTVQLTQQLQFNPAKIQIHAGDTVQFVNASNHNHTVTADPSLAKNPADVILPDGAAPFSSDTITPGRTFSHVFTVPGLYQFTCLPHEKFGMIGQVVVLQADGE